MKTLKFFQFLFLTASLLFSIDCKERDANNPFDTDCPKEVFTPSNFSGQQKGLGIELIWRQANKNISGFVISRNENNGVFIEVARIDKAVSLWNDNKIVGGTKYGYKLIAYAGANLSNSQEVSVTTSVSVSTVTTVLAASNITTNSVVLGGNVIDDGGVQIAERGICYNTSTNPTTANSKVIMGNGTGQFSGTITGLTTNTKYFAKAYAKNSYGTSYGAEITFTTAQLSVATVTTSAATSFGLTTAILGGNVTSDGNNAVTENGICYSLAQNPTTASTKIAIGSGTGVFSNLITGLAVNTTYYVRAYAINSLGTAYGNEITFTTRQIAVPTLTTTAATSITLTTAISGGTITSDGGGSITERGVCWATTATPTITNSKTSDGPVTGSFVSNLTLLLPGTTYYVRAYSTNSAGTAYGNEISFTTSAVLSATLTTTAVTSITLSTAVSGGNITADGGGAITAKGVCWATTTGPTTASSKTSDGTGTGSFVSNLTGLLPGTTYFLRAYATNSAGTTYGNEVTFTTSSVAVPTLTTVAVSSVTLTTAVSGGNITADGGGAITAKGVCWSTTTGPTVTGSKTVDGTGSGSFVSNLSGLLPGTTYFIRAYATNSAGTAYGNEVSFTTGAIAVATLTTSAVTSVTLTTAVSGGNITADGGGSVTARGVCWATTAIPTIANSKTVDGTGLGSFVSNITLLLPGTTYYVCAYATNSAGTAYGNVVSFTTNPVGTATLTTTAVTSITLTTAVSGGNIVSDGGGAITARGICWATTTAPTINGSKTSNGTGTGSFISNLTLLLPGTTYYVRAYATNSSGTAYGNEVSFTTSQIVPATLTTTAITAVTLTTAASGGNISSDGGGTITARGVCWATTTAPTISNYITSDATGTGIFTSNLSGLLPGITYYVRAYATNSAGTAYGNQVNFYTFQIADNEGNYYNTVTIGTQVWMKENLKTTKFNDNSTIPLVTDNTSWGALSTPGYCWFNNDAATYKATYGALYNWYVVDAASNGGKNVCLTGWHVPSDAEWTTLTNYLGGESVAGGKLKESGYTHWLSPNTGATNESSFTALPGGNRTDYGVFNDIGYFGYWWSTTQYSSTFAWLRYLFYNNYPATRVNYNNKSGFSVRCLKN